MELDPCLRAEHNAPYTPNTHSGSEKAKKAGEKPSSPPDPSTKIGYIIELPWRQRTAAGALPARAVPRKRLEVRRRLHTSYKPRKCMHASIHACMQTCMCPCSCARFDYRAKTSWCVVSLCETVAEKEIERFIWMGRQPRRL